MQKPIRPSKAASKAILKAHMAMAKAAAQVTESLVRDLRGTGTRAEGLLSLEITIFDKKSGKEVGEDLKGITITVLGS